MATKKSLAIKTDQLDFTPEQTELIKNTIAVGATNDELKLFLYHAKRTGLDPLSRQIYFVKRQGKGTIQTSIDGFRTIAERSKEYGGQDEPKYDELPGSKYPKKCTVTVYRFHGEQRYPAAVGVAYWDEYKPAAGQDFMWTKMPHGQLSKVAEALALRKAFPQDLSGIYTDEEMAQATSQQDGKTVKQQNGQPVDGEVVETQPTESKQPQIRKYFAVAKSAGFTSEKAEEYIKKINNVASMNDLTDQQFSQAIEYMNRRINQNNRPISVEQEQRLMDLIPKKGKTFYDLKNALLTAFPNSKGDYTRLTWGQAQTVIQKLESMPDVKDLKLNSETKEAPTVEQAAKNAVGAANQVGTEVNEKDEGNDIIIDGMTGNDIEKGIEEMKKKEKEENDKVKK